MKLVDQDQEAMLGYLAATAAFPDRSERIVVWDIGGASMQMILRDKSKKYIICRGKTASVYFKEKILL
jgi:exopolyphosphatase/pppGpp-phosphohydrolase